MTLDTQLVPSSDSSFIYKILKVKVQTKNYYFALSQPSFEK